MNTSRISGLASGMDTEQMIKDLMKIERTKVDRLEQEKKIQLWKQENYNDINKDFANFILDTKKDFELTTTTSFGTFLNSSLDSLSWVKLGTSSNEDIAAISTNSNAINGSYDIHVDRLADGISMASGSNISQGDKANIMSQFNLTLDPAVDTIEFTLTTEVGSKKFIIGNTPEVENDSQLVIDKDLDQISIEEIVDKINSAKIKVDGVDKSLGVNAVYDSNIDRFFFQSENTGTNSTIQITNDNANGQTFIDKLNLNVNSYKSELVGGNITNFDFSVNNLEVDINGTTVLLDAAYVDADAIAGAISAQLSDIDVVAVGNTLVFSSYKDSIQIASGASGNISDIGLTEGTTQRQEVSEILTLNRTYSGIDAQLDFAGANDITQSSNNFTINGIDINLKSTGDFTVNIDTNVDSIYEKIENFVNKYNELIDNIGKKLGEKRYRDYTPLTDEQKEAMTETEIELWEQKAMSGLLRNDAIISRTVQDIRQGFYEDVEGVTGIFKHLTEIGIATEQYSSGEVGGKLEINEIKLREAIQNDADSVIELLFKQPDSSITDEDEIEKNSGIVTRLYDNMIDGMKEIINKAGTGDDSNLLRNVQSNILVDFVTEYGSISRMDDSIFDIEDRIYDLNQDLSVIEERYWQKFTAMEKALQQMNQQSQWLMSQIGGQM